MAVTKDHDAGAPEGQLRTTGAVLRRLPKEVSKQTLNAWKDSMAEYVRAELFDNFFVTDEELVMGGPIQTLVCSYINICGRERARVYTGRKKTSGGPECNEASIQTR
jgi:hypothetical protein